MQKKANEDKKYNYMAILIAKFQRVVSLQVGKVQSG